MQVKSLNFTGIFLQPNTVVVGGSINSLEEKVFRDIQQNRNRFPELSNGLRYSYRLTQQGEQKSINRVPYDKFILDEDYTIITSQNVPNSDDFYRISEKKLFNI